MLDSTRLAICTLRTLAVLWLGASGGIAAADSLNDTRAAGGPLWVHQGQLTPQARQVIDAMRRVEDFGLDNQEFVPLISHIEAEAEAPDDPAQLEASMNAAVWRLVEDLHDGRVDPRLAGYELSRRRAPLDPAATLRDLAGSTNPLTALSAVEPRARQYLALKQMLARYRNITARPVSAPPGARLIRAGYAYADAEELRLLLTAFGDFPESSQPEPGVPGVYDAALAAAVAHFQHRHGLQSDGVLGPRTFAALSVPAAQRIRQIELTMERWRWLPEIQAPAVIVNVPQYVLYALPRPADPDPGAQALKIPVIVGLEDKQTPVFDSRIEAVVIRPYWEVPRSITVQELLPRIERNPEYLARHDLEIVRAAAASTEVLPVGQAAVAELRAGRARLRQRPGVRNSLGLIKFVLPNAHDVYLHSTPETQLFARDSRALSHGCVRVSDATALAAYLLKDTPGSWSYAAIDAATCLDATFTVRLAKPVPIYIVYCTVVVDRNGDALFFDDVYGYDRALEALLVNAAGAQVSADRSSRPRVSGGAHAAHSMAAP